MINAEKYVGFVMKEMQERGNCLFGLTKKGEPKLCRHMECKDCVFHSVDKTCLDFRREWLTREADPPIIEQLMETVRETIVECSDISCEDCVYYTLNDISRKRASCLAGRITDAINNTFDITIKEDK